MKHYRAPWLSIYGALSSFSGQGSVVAADTAHCRCSEHRPASSAAATNQVSQALRACSLPASGELWRPHMWCSTQEEFTGFTAPASWQAATSASACVHQHWPLAVVHAVVGDRAQEKLLQARLAAASRQGGQGMCQAEGGAPATAAAVWQAQPHWLVAAAAKLLCLRPAST
jgi:hypothetical protein